jgi:hypothetical protein
MQEAPSDASGHGSQGPKTVTLIQLRVELCYEYTLSFHHELSMVVCSDRSANVGGHVIRSTPLK